MNESVYYHMLGSSGLITGLSAQVAGELGRRIVAGVYQSGDLVEDEISIARRFDVSRTVIREAIKILVAKGLINIRRGIGSRVTPRNEWQLLDGDVLAWHHAAPFCAKTLMQLMEIRFVLEPNAAGWAAQRATDADLQSIHDATAQMALNCDSPESFVLADAEFHRTILKAAHNDFLAAMEGVIYASLLMSISQTNKTAAENKDSITLHQATARAIIKRQRRQAENKMRLLLNDASARLLTILPQSPETISFAQGV